MSDKKHVLVGLVLAGVKIADDQGALLFETDKGPIVARADGDCCSRTWVEHVELPALGFPATVVSVDNLDLPGSDDDHPEHDCLQVYGLKIVTDRGEIVIDYRNSSNGYYGGSLEWPGDHFYGGVYEPERLGPEVARFMSDQKLASGADQITLQDKDLRPVATVPQIDAIHYGPVWSKPRSNGKSFSACDSVDTSQPACLTTHTPWVTSEPYDFEYAPTDDEMVERDLGRRALLDARSEALANGCRAVLGLIELIRERDDLTPELREVLQSNHRIAEALAALAKAGGA